MTVISLMTIIATALFVRVANSDAMTALSDYAPVEALAANESPYPYACYQTLGYCSGSGAGLSWKCIMTTSGDRCSKWYCKVCD